MTLRSTRTKCMENIDAVLKAENEVKKLQVTQC